MRKRIFCFYAVFLLAAALTTSNAQSDKATLVWEDVKPMPKEMSDYWTILDVNDGEILAYAAYQKNFKLVRFDKDYNVSAQGDNAVEKGLRLFDIWVRGDDVAAIMGNGKGISLYRYDRRTLSERSHEQLFANAEFKFGKWGGCSMYTNVIVERSPNGRYTVVFAFYSHNNPADFNSNHVFLYDENFRLVNHWSVDENYKLQDHVNNWDFYYPTLQVTDEGVVYYAAVSDPASNGYASNPKWGTGSSLHVHVMSETSGMSSYDFGLVAEKTHLNHPAILSASADRMTLYCQSWRYQPKGDFVHEGSRVMELDLNEKKVVREKERKWSSDNPERTREYASVTGYLNPVNDKIEGGKIIFFERGIDFVSDDWQQIGHMGMGSGWEGDAPGGHRPCTTV